eukprot:3566838-Rhodomonas_salina.2
MPVRRQHWVRHDLLGDRARAQLAQPLLPPLKLLCLPLRTLALRLQPLALLLQPKHLLQQLRLVQRRWHLTQHTTHNTTQHLVSYCIRRCIPPSQICTHLQAAQELVDSFGDLGWRQRIGHALSGGNARRGRGSGRGGWQVVVEPVSEPMTRGSAGRTQLCRGLEDHDLRGEHGLDLAPAGADKEPGQP